ncbi:MAG TPA: hypothetical protein VFP41_07610 [Actinomycetota bacterium]|nr:hypothetical protein [Actinomycetota bacterium]
MDHIDRNDLQRLVAVSPETGPRTSIYLPTNRSGADTTQDAIRLKNLLRDAATTLGAMGWRAPEVTAYLERAAALLQDPIFWRHQVDGLAVFVGPGDFRAFRLPLRFDEHAIVGDRYHVKPLLPYFAADGHFFVLAMSQNRVRLLEGSRHSVDELELQQVPTSLAEALRYDDMERELLLHVAGRSPASPAIFHGHGAGGEVDKERLDRFLGQVDRGIVEILRGDHAHVVLAGVGYVTARYRALSSLVTIERQTIEGNPDELRAEELHERAWDIVEPRMQDDINADLARFAELDGTGRTSSDLAEILPAATQGRIDVLFAAQDIERWGRASVEPLGIHDEPLPGDEDLVDAAVVEALRTNARVHVLPASSLPGEAVAAIMRH